MATVSGGLWSKRNRHPVLSVSLPISLKLKKAYETAIETALGGSIQNVVTKDEKTAKLMIEYLKRNRFGRATFLPMTSIVPKNTE